MEIKEAILFTVIMSYGLIVGYCGGKEIIHFSVMILQPFIFLGGIGIGSLLFK